MSETRTDPGRLMRAKHPGTCAECDGTIEAGDAIYYSRQLGSRHQRCVDGSDGGAPQSGFGFLDSPPVHSPQAERETIASLLTSPAESCKEAFSILEPGDFHVEQHRGMFVCLREAWRDQATYWSSKHLVEWLVSSEKAKKLAAKWSRFEPITATTWADCAEEGEAAQGGPQPSDLAFYVKALRRMRAKRGMRYTILEALQAAQDGLEPDKWCRKVKSDLSAVERVASAKQTNGKVKQ